MIYFELSTNTTGYSIGYLQVFSGETWGKETTWKTQA
jgi:hypothetical protein